MFTFAQKNINFLKIKNESNYDGLISLMQKQFLSVEESNQIAITQGLEEIIKTFDLFFENDISKRKCDYLETEKLKNEMEKIISEISKVLNNDSFSELIKDYKNNVYNSLINQKYELESNLKGNNYQSLLTEIKREIDNNLSQLDQEIENKLNEIEKYCKFFYNKAKRCMEKFNTLENEISLNPLENLKEKIAKNIGGDSDIKIAKEIIKEMKNSCEGLGNVFEKKGFLQWVTSLFNKKEYLKNIIEMMEVTFMRKIYFYANLLNNGCKMHFSFIKRQLNYRIEFLTMAFNENQIKEWEKLVSKYKQTKEKIKKLGFNLH